ncbi:MAG: ABC transporter permease [Frisingicoccus sp.]|uniref:ABC transporter permease n=1 Tax=Frisingicoccus sp. TaxID=1918627 RepID=UPI002A83B857|nr:ABC transporter permease [Frisingicoccus sp.]MDY4833816.1 ABC transporter permease [Frisingicoccus sp.]
MRFGFYLKLALSGIRNNKKTYVPYILTGIGMVMMYYIVAFLSCSSSVTSMHGGGVVREFLSLGSNVIALFALILLFYTNSFLMKRRKKEFGLYNILGMGKNNLSRVLIWETLIISAVSIIGGLGCGILFSKAVELFIGRMLGSNVSFRFEILQRPISKAFIIFAVIFILILINSLRQIYFSKPIELIHSESVGEKPPKGNWFIALIGAGLLFAAYYISVTISDPVSAVVLFFVAVLMVIIATYLLFIAGSVVFCRLLQKNKAYYYKTNHFISISSLVYRMKRNGAGLASICILSTMVLVMISSTFCLYIGGEENLRNRYPRDIIMDLWSIDEGITDQAHNLITNTLDEYDLEADNLLHYRYLGVAALQKDGKMLLDQKMIDQPYSYADMRQLYIIPLDDYNQIMGTSEVLQDGEVMICASKCHYDYDTLEVEQMPSFNVRKAPEAFVANGESQSLIFPSLFIFVKDIETLEQFYENQLEIYQEEASRLCDYYGFDLDCDEKTKIEIAEKIVSTPWAEDATSCGFSLECRAESREDFLAVNSGFFVLGILLGTVFICGTVLIMYYKQIVEGYEDQARFDILQKVGMTKEEIRKSINSQILTIFFVPLLTAGIHIIFAFPVVAKLLLLFGLTNTKLFVMVNVGTYLVFASFYILFYMATSRAYYKIVSET